ncbi:MAG TPA: hypothetical protein VF459_13160 [Caulobacteraceae bacterium]
MSHEANAPAGIANRSCPARAWPAAAIVTMAVAVLGTSFCFAGLPSDSEPLNLVWTTQVGDAFAHGELYPRWLPRSFGGLGAPVFYFYPPLAFFLSGVLKFAGLSAEQAVNGAALVILVASGSAMYAWLRHRGTRPLLGALIYMVAPYHLVDFYARGDLAEFGGFVWLPLIALGLDGLRKPWGAPLLAVAWAALILTHLPTAVLATVFLICPLALLAIWKNQKVILPGLAAATLGLGLAAIYLLPALTLQSHVNMDLLWTEKYRTENWFIWKWRNPPLFLLCLPLAAASAILVSLRARSFWSVLTVTAALAAFGLLPIWAIPPLNKMQFPWRALGIMEFAAVTALAAAPPRPIVTAAAIALAIQSYGMTGLIVWAAIGFPKPWYDKILFSMDDAVEYLPAGLAAAGIRRLPNLERYQRLPAANPVIVVQKPGPMTLRLAAFPIWRITRDGKPVASHGPLLTFDGTPGVYRLERVATPQETLGAMVSALALLATLSWWAVSHRRGSRP